MASNDTDLSRMSATIDQIWNHVQHQAAKQDLNNALLQRLATRVESQGLKLQEIETTVTSLAPKSLPPTSEGESGATPTSPPLPEDLLVSIQQEMKRLSDVNEIHRNVVISKLEEADDTMKSGFDVVTSVMNDLQTRIEALDDKMIQLQVMSIELGDAIGKLTSMSCYVDTKLKEELSALKTSVQEASLLTNSNLCKQKDTITQLQGAVMSKSEQEDREILKKLREMGEQELSRLDEVKLCGSETLKKVGELATTVGELVKKQ